MDAYSWVGVALLTVAVGLILFVAAAEAGLISISRARVRLMAGRGVPRAEILQSYVQERESLLGALALARNLAMVSGAAIAAAVLTRERGHAWLVVIVVVVVALVAIGLLEAVPRVLVSRNPERWGLRLSPFMGAFKFVFGVPARLLALPVRAVARPPEADEEQEILRLIELEEDEGTLEEDEKKMIRGVFGLEDTAVREIMTPRTDIVALEAGATSQEAVRLIVERGFSRVPIYDESIDKIVGVVYAKDLMSALAGSRPEPATLRAVARPPFFVPESKRVDELLTDMRRERKHMVIVVDEYGGTAGLATIEDLLEEIVGEIEDEHDPVGARSVRLSETEAEFDGRVAIDDLNEAFHTEIKAAEFDTVGGCVLHLLGKMPEVGDEAQTDGLRLRVLAIDGHRVKRVRVSVAEPLATPPDGEDSGRANGKKTNGAS